MDKNNAKFEFSRLGGIGLPIQRHKKMLPKVGGMYIPYDGDGLAIKTDNNYPDILAKVAADSPTHGGALDKKSKLTFGQGFDISKDNKELNEAMQKWLNSINSDTDTINDIYKRASMDLVYFGGFALRVRWAYDGTIAAVYHVPFKMVRKGVPVNGKVQDYIISNNWDGLTMSELEHNEQIPAFNPDNITAAKQDESGRFERDENDNIIIDEKTRENAEQLIYYQRYSVAGSGFYPVPDYINGLDSAFVEVESVIAMLNGIRNGINGAVIFSNDDDGIQTDEGNALVIKKIAEKGTGAANANNIYYMDSKVKVTKIDPPKADVYSTVNAAIKNNIVTAHGIPAILLEVSLSGGFNNRAEEMKAAIYQFQKTHILGYQQELERVFNSILSHTKYDVELKIRPFLDEEEQADTNTPKSGETPENGQNKPDKDTAGEKTNIQESENI